MIATTDQVSCELADEVVVLSLASGEYYGLSTVAAVAWDLIQVERSVAEVRDALLDEFEGPSKEECEDELLQLLQELLDLELIRVS